MKKVFVVLLFIFAVGTGIMAQTSPSVFGDSSIYDITWGNGKFVAVGKNGKIAFSSNGVNWTLVKNSSFEESAIGGITFGNGKFVAVGDEGKIAVSQDGIVWTTVKNTAFGDSGIYDIAFGNGLFVAVGDDNKIAVSQDGNIWDSKINSPFDNDNRITHVVFGNGKFVISRWGRGNDVIAVSSDAKNWVKTNQEFNGYGFPFIYDIAFGNGQFIAVGNTGMDSAFMYASHDGLTWTWINHDFHPQGGEITTAAWGNGKFIAVGEDGALAISDGKNENWVALVMNKSYGRTPILSTIFSVIYANGKFVGVGVNGYIATSPDGINWTDIRTGLGNFHYGDFHYTESGGKLTILRYRGESENVSIPAVINGKPVVEIGEYAFNYNFYTPTSVTIPDSVKTIGNSAFSSYKLTSITIGANITLAYYAFGYDGFEEAYTANNKQAGTYTRPNADSKTWTRK